MTPTELDEIEARAEAATEGPWEANPEESHDYYLPGFAVLYSDSKDQFAGCVADCVGDLPTAVFIAYARVDVPALVKEIRRLNAELLSLEGQLEERPLDTWALETANRQLLARVAHLEEALHGVISPLSPGPCNCFKHAPDCGGDSEWMAALRAAERGLEK